MLEKNYLLLLIVSLVASIIGFQRALWSLPSLVFFAINLALLFPALFWIEEVGDIAGKLERKITKSKDIKAGLLSGFIYILAVWLLTAVFVLISAYRLIAYILS